LRRFWLSILLTVQLLAFDTVTASKIFSKIFGAMFVKQSISVYTINKKYQDVIVTASSLELVKYPESADILLVDKIDEVPKHGKYIIFTTNFSVFEKNKDAVGAFYWEHGRPKIVFIKDRLEAKNLTLSKSFQRYIVKKISR
jgi:hypothetical protein